MGEAAPILTDAVFTRISRGPPPTPLPFVLNAPWEQYDGALVTLDGVLLDRKLQDGGLRLLLRTGDYVFEAQAPDAVLQERLRAMPANSKLRITGVCLVRSGGMWSAPESFRLLIRSAGDVTLLRAPSWWNLRHTMWLLALTAGVLLIVLAWTAVLGRRLREQMEIVKQRLRSGAVLEERNRIARELHDTLEQELAGITMQLDLASDCFAQVPEVAREAVEAARQMSRHSMLEARRSVWDLRCHLLESGDLVTALKEILKPLTPHAITINIETNGTPVRLSSRVELNLLRIGQEAVANALRHAQCHQIDVSLSYAPAEVCLSVQDDGRGFVPDQPAGHFGLLDIRERAESIGAQLEIKSQPGMGTTIAVAVQTAGARVKDEEPQSHTYSGG
jgi:signal transduction histidine kinase